MRTLNHLDTANIAAGMSCKEALIWGEDDIAKYCTQAQFTTYVLAIVDLMYNYPGYDDLDWDEQEDLERIVIRGLQF